MVSLVAAASTVALLAPGAVLALRRARGVRAPPRERLAVAEHGDHLRESVGLAARAAGQLCAQDAEARRSERAVREAGVRAQRRLELEAVCLRVQA